MMKQNCCCAGTTSPSTRCVRGERLRLLSTAYRHLNTRSHNHCQSTANFPLNAVSASQMGSGAIANQSAYMNGKTAGCAACSDTPPPPADYSCPQQVI